MRFVGLFLYLIISGCVARAQAQSIDRPVRGIVWQEPVGLAGAVADLHRMRAMGIEAVRTGPIRTAQLFQEADTLGLTFFQELPVARLPARRLLDTLAYAEQNLRALLPTARRHSSARVVGLARGSDTSDSTACAYFEQLARVARSGSGGSVRVYYVTRFIESDACGSTVDFVLIDALGRPDPVDLLRRWRDAHPDVPAGIAAIGRFVADDRAQGVNVPGSPDDQARYLERSLRRLLLDDQAAPAYGVFVHRWRDVQRERPSPAFDLENPYRHAFGLYTMDGQPRRSVDVVSGIFGRGQDAFAYPAGRRPAGREPISTIGGWIVLIILGLAYASSPRMRPMVPRYFTAHGFYREAVREGRDVLMTASIVLLVALSVAVGIIWLVVLNTWRTSEQFLLFYQMLPQSVEEFIVTIMARPLLFVLLVSSVYAVTMTVWSAILSFGSRRRYPLAPAQALMLAIWPRWGVILLMIAAMAIATLPPEQGFLPAGYVLLAWVGVTLVATARTLYDYAAVTRVRPAQIVLGLLLNPIVLLLLIGGVLALRYQPEVTFLWHALTLS